VTSRERLAVGKGGRTAKLRLKRPVSRDFDYLRLQGDFRVFNDAIYSVTSHSGTCAVNFAANF
jgi:hypothetical protein